MRTHTDRWLLCREEPGLAWRTPCPAVADCAMPAATAETDGGRLYVPVFYW